MTKKKLRELENRYRDAAQGKFEEDGDLEFDDEAAVNMVDHRKGAYVQCWKWIPASCIEECKE